MRQRRVGLHLAVDLELGRALAQISSSASRILRAEACRRSRNRNARSARSSASMPKRRTWSAQRDRHVGDLLGGGVVAHMGVGEKERARRGDDQRQRGEVPRAGREADDVPDVPAGATGTARRGRRSARRPRRDAPPARRSPSCWCAPACARRRASRPCARRASR